MHSGSVQGPFGPISDQNFQRQKFKISKIFKLCGRRHCSGCPLAAVPSPAALRALAAEATAAQIENFSEKVSEKKLKVLSTESLLMRDYESYNLLEKKVVDFGKPRQQVVSFFIQQQKKEKTR